MKIRIQGQATVRFSQTKTMTKAEYKELRETLEQGDTTILEAWVDVTDMDGIEFEPCDIDVDAVTAAHQRQEG